MFYDLSPYLSFNAFVAVCVIALVLIACVGNYFDNEKGE